LISYATELLFCICYHFIAAS